MSILYKQREGMISRQSATLTRILEHSAIGKSSLRRANMTWPGSTHSSNPPLKDNDFSDKPAAAFWLQKQWIIYKRDQI